MGLDQYIKHMPDGGKEQFELFYYRKVSQLQHYFEKNFGIENGGVIELDEEIVKDIISLTDGVLEYKDTEDAQEVAVKLFPTANGFMYGNEEYSYAYYRTTEIINEDMKHLLENQQEGLKNREVFYSCSY